MKVGILGAGQLGRMLALAGIPMNMEFVLFDPAADACGRHLGEFINASFDDEASLQMFADKVDVITVEFEHIPVKSLEWLNKSVPVYPPPAIVAAAQDRLLEKQLFTRLEIPNASYQAVDNEQQFLDYCSGAKRSLVAKSRHAGYDGKGQARIHAGTDLHSAWKELAGVPMIVEDMVAFDREVSVVAVRNTQGDTAFYPLSQNRHANGILDVTDVSLNDPLMTQAEDYAQRIMDELNYVGVLTVEFFDCGGELMANEMAPRVHNSGHWTIEGAETSQFENHLRAICGLPLGSTQSTGPSMMFNVVGEMPARESVLAIPGAHWHDYGKQPRQGRKLGHITLTAENSQQLQERQTLLQAVLHK